MSEQHNFYITLTSDSSLKDYEDNKTSSFTVSLPKAISLNGSWEICLVECHYPHTIYNATEKNNRLIYQFKRISRTEPFELNTVPIEIPIGHYCSVEEVLRALNDAVEKFTVGNYGSQIKLFSISAVTGKVECNRENLDNIVKQINDKHGGRAKDTIIVPDRLYLEGTLAVMLGFNPFENDLLKNTEGENIPNIRFGISSKLLMYCDLIEPQIIGHRHAQVIKVMSTLDPDVKYGDVIVRQFSSRQYVDVLNKHFNTIHIDIRTSDGRKMPFGFGEVYALFHLRKKNLFK